MLYLVGAGVNCIALKMFNEYGEVVYLKSIPSKSDSLEGLQKPTTPQMAADRYLSSILDAMELKETQKFSDAFDAAEMEASTVPIAIFEHEKDIGGLKVVIYTQRAFGLEIFDARLGIQVDDQGDVSGAQSSFHSNVRLINTDAKVTKDVAKDLSKADMKKLLGFSLPNINLARITRQVIYRYEPENRDLPVQEHHDDDSVASKIPKLDKLKTKLEKGDHVIVNEVLFEAALGKGGETVNWRMFVMPGSNDVVYLRALVAGATAMVFDRDPQTQTGATVTGASSNAVLNPFRSSVTLQGLTPSIPQKLSGEYVEIVDIDAPSIAPPTQPNIFGAFNYNVRTDNFSAVNAYYHCDQLFRRMDEYGFNVASYFGGTSFPVPIDHRGKSNAVNASANGNSTGTGLGKMLYGVLQAGQPVGIATSNRVVLHEFGHALLWNHVNSPNFGFAHSAGDSLAAILNDPGTAETDRFDTFPWVQQATNLGRRHDRSVAGGWGWFGANYNTGYRGEQILSSTMFRFYRAIGGDSTNINTRTRAAETSAYLIFKGIGLLTSTTSIPNVFVSNLQTADTTTADFKGVSGGALHKVVRWAFEKQGLFQPAAVPGTGNTVTAEGNPPDVDVYINDGRDGEYEYQRNHWNCQDMWVRLAPDGGLLHQQPVVGQTNYMYVQVKNRGMNNAYNVTVDTYHALPGTGLAFPDDWTPMTTATLPASGPIAPGGSDIIGPFAFTPTNVGHECLMAIAHADGDLGNDTTITGTIDESRLVPFDNNIAQRNVNPVYPSWRHLARMFEKHVFWIRNPYKKGVIGTVKIKLPRFLRELGWAVKLEGVGGGKFEMGPHEKRKVAIHIKQGKEFDQKAVRRAMEKSDAEISFETYLDGHLSGGMSYPLSFSAGGKEEDRDEDPCEPKKPIIISRTTIEEILRILRRHPTIGRTIGRFPIQFDDDLV